MYTAERFRREIVKIIIAANIEYMRHFEDIHGSSETIKVFGPNKQIAYYAVEILNNDRYKVYYFRTIPGMIKEIRKDFFKYKKLLPDLALVAHPDLLSNRSYDKVVDKQISHFLRRLMFYDLTHRRFKSIADKAELFIYKQEIISKKKLFDLLVTKGKWNISSFDKYYGAMTEEGEDISERVKHYTRGDWDIYLDVKTNRNIDEVERLLDDVSSLLKKRGYGKLCYGKVLLVDNLGGKTLADYDPKGDLMRIGFKMLKKSNIENQIISTIHELGHRNYFKFLTSKQRGESNSKFLTEVKLKKGTFDVKKGEIITSITSGDRYRVEDSRYKRSFKYIVSLVELGKETRNKTKDLNQRYSIDEKYIGVEFVPEGAVESQNTYIPRPYGMKDEQEFYAVLWETWFQNKLRDPAKTWFEGLER